MLDLFFLGNKDVVFMYEKKITQLQNKINKIKKELQNIGDMRPGSLTKQFKNPKEKIGPFYQLSYTYQMKSKTEYVRPAFLKELKTETANFKKFKKLVDTWIDLSLELSKLKIDLKKDMLKNN